MKHIFTPLFILLLIVLNAQTKQDVIKKMSVSSCDCSKKLDMSTLSPDETTMEIGICILDAFSTYKEEYQIATGKEISLQSEDFEKLANDIGLEMINNCPDLVMSLGMKMTDEEMDEEDMDIITATGRITKLEKNQFYTIIFETDSGEVIKILYLFEVEGGNIIFNQKLWDKPITIGYGREELFSAQTDSPSNFNILYYIE